MKKLMFIALLAVSTTIGWAQGTLNFANGAAGVNAPVRDTDTTTMLSGSGFVADFYYAAGSGQSEGSLVAFGANQAFATGASAGYFLGGTKTLSGIGAGSVVTVQVRAWRVSDGATYEAAQAASGKIGRSNLIDVTLGGGVNPAANLVGLQAFNLTQVPEPSTFALGALGIGALLMVRRRKA